MDRHILQSMVEVRDGTLIREQVGLIVEEPLSIRIEGASYAVVMRTPGEEKEHVAGFCLAEGLVEGPGDIVTIGFCTEAGTNVATVTLTDTRRQQVAELLERKGFVSQTSCGICGKAVVDDIRQVVVPIAVTARFPAARLMALVDDLPRRQSLNRETRGAHAAMILDAREALLSLAEDVGRHNALDKAIGRVMMEGRLSDAALGIVSSRLSYEMVQKAARAGLQVLVGLSRPTALAVDLARSVGITLVCVQSGRLMVFGEASRVFI
ncbi:formate dehydrogenase accessory sulfurtransferase FdhD [Desulfosudis oleivorans]|nr:formate dehydrogenase accessory sulfurtransferase FdhD [Desulfosudis oleivorans]